MRIRCTECNKNLREDTKYSEWSKLYNFINFLMLEKQIEVETSEDMIDALMNFKPYAEDISEWVDVDWALPDNNNHYENKWVLGLCKLTLDSLKDYDPVVFQVKYNSKGKVWSDWCGDTEEAGDFKVIGWKPLPELELD